MDGSLNDPYVYVELTSLKSLNTLQQVRKSPTSGGDILFFSKSGMNTKMHVQKNMENSGFDRERGRKNRKQ